MLHIVHYVDDWLTDRQSDRLPNRLSDCYYNVVEEEVEFCFDSSSPLFLIPDIWKSMIISKPYCSYPEAPALPGVSTTESNSPC